MLDSSTLHAIAVGSRRAPPAIDRRCWVSASYWDDDTIKRYQTLGLLACDGVKISLTDTGRRACGSTAAGVSLYHPI